MHKKGMRLSLYPSTERIKNSIEYQVTEKIDGSNLTICKTDEGLIVATRNNVFHFTDKDQVMASNLKLGGLKPWLQENYESLREDLHVGSAICGEWVADGVLKYDEYHHKFVLFGKGRINLEDMPSQWELTKLMYNVELLIYPFLKQEIPEYIELVPLVDVIEDPSIQNLDKMYDKYTEKVGRDVEGFVIEDLSSGAITKYVRMKTGRLQPHKE